MNTRPKTKRFRVRRSLTLEQREAALNAARDAGNGMSATPDAPPASPAPTGAALPGTEGLTSRQLRLARRLAERRGLKVSSDEEALEALRARGIDPFAPGRLQIVPGQDAGQDAPSGAGPDPAAPPAAAPVQPRPSRPPAEQAPTSPPPASAGAGAASPDLARAQQPPTPSGPSRAATDRPEEDAPSAQVPARTAPQPLPPATTPEVKPPAPVDVPSPNDNAQARHAAEIMAMQAQLARRRQLKMISLGIRLAAFVLLPTILAGIYFAFIASPMYSTESSFYLQKSDPMATGAVSAAAANPLLSAKDSVSVQNYLLSREAMMRLDEDVKFREAFQSPKVDALQRLDPNASNEEAFRQYLRVVKVGFDPTEGIINLDVVAPSPELGVTASKKLIEYASEQVDAQTLAMRHDRMDGAKQSVDDAEAKLHSAQARVLKLQEQRGVLSADAEASMLMNQISTFEVKLKKERLTLQSLLDNPEPNQTRVEVTRNNIGRLEKLITDMRSQMTEDGSGSTSLAKVTGELTIAESELKIRQQMLGKALEALEAARIEASRQASYLIQDVKPLPTDEPSYPRVFENTLLAFLFFAGIYLMLSLTASILREQVTS